MTTPTALVTGAGKGIGKAIAAGLAARGFDVWLGARDRSRGTAAATDVGGRIVMVSSMRGSLAEPGAWVGQPSMPYSSSKTALNALTAHYAHELADTGIKGNSACPGHVATDFNAFRGARTPDDGAVEAIRLATMGPDGPTGKSFQDGRELAW